MLNFVSEKIGNYFLQRVYDFITLIKTLQTKPLSQFQ